MIKASGIDTDALVAQFAEASAKQGDVLRKAVGDATLKALQGREVTLQNIRSVIKTITQAASTGIAKNTLPSIDAEALIGKALEGMDSALLKTVEANRKALQQFVDQGVGLQQGRLKEAVGNLEKMEDVFFSTVSKAVQTGSAQFQKPWESVLAAMKMKGTETGTRAADAVEKLMSQTQSTLRNNRAMGLRTAQAMMDSYSTLVSGVLIGMSEALQQPPSKAGAVTETQAPAAGTKP